MLINKAKYVLIALIVLLIQGDYLLALDFSDPYEVALQKVKYGITIDADGIKSISCKNISERYINMLNDNRKKFISSIEGTMFEVYGKNNKKTSRSICKIIKSIKNRIYLSCDGYVVVRKNNGEYIGKMEISKYVELILEGDKYLFCPLNLEKSNF